MGAGAVISFGTNTRLDIKTNQNCTFKNVTIKDGIAPVTGTTNGGLILVTGASTVNVTGCTLTGGTARYAGDLVYQSAGSGKIIITNSVLTNTGPTSMFYGQTIECTGCTITASASANKAYIGYFTGVGTETFTNCMFSKAGTQGNYTLFNFYNSQKGYFSGTTTMCRGAISVSTISGTVLGAAALTISGYYKTLGYIEATTYGLVTFISGSTIYAKGNETGVIVRAKGTAAFTIEDNVTLVNASGVTSTIAAGTYTDKQLKSDGSFVVWS